VYVGALEADLLLPPSTRSLKAKRAVVRPLLADLRRRFAVTCAEVGEVDLHGRAVIGVAAVSGEMGHLREVLDTCERFLADRPETTLLSVRSRIYRPDD
jgi:hypothetical protein